MIQAETLTSGGDQHDSCNETGDSVAGLPDYSFRTPEGCLRTCLAHDQNAPSESGQVRVGCVWSRQYV